MQLKAILVDFLVIFPIFHCITYLTMYLFHDLVYIIFFSSIVFILSLFQEIHNFNFTWQIVYVSFLPCMILFKILLQWLKQPFYVSSHIGLRKRAPVFMCSVHIAINNLWDNFVDRWYFLWPVNSIVFC